MERGCASSAAQSLETRPAASTLASGTRGRASVRTDEESSEHGTETAAVQPSAGVWARVRRAPRWKERAAAAGERGETESVVTAMRNTPCAAQKAGCEARGTTWRALRP